MIFPVTTSSLTLAIISCLAPSVMAGTLGGGGTGNVYFYNCGNCKCDAAASKTGFTGQSDCFGTGPETRAVGLTGQSGNFPRKTTCELYTDTECKNGFQSVGVEYGQTWGCSAFNQNAGSVRCWYNK
ncbi:hypothetical protein V490_08475 [Pseudogymnoascus sp. VKM F-3557]|nr:hypothetical protein V490_08475 [Pseudogymnoascus sp. VKM F-3557]